MRRRDVLMGLGAALVTACARGENAAPGRAASPGAAGEAPASDPFAALEASVGGRVGVYALDTGSGRQLGRREDERFAMCSTFKWALVAAILARVDRGELALDERVPYGASDLLEYAPATRAHVGEGSMTVEALAQAAITKSDNTAANLLLTRVDGPAGLTRFLRRTGDPITRLDRNEVSLNGNERGDVRDTTSPRAMANLLRLVLCGDALSPPSRARLEGWLRACETGKERLRAGLPADWAAGDKTGTGANGAVNDVAFVVPPGRAPLVIAAYLSESRAPLAALVTAHAEIARIVARELGRTAT